MKLPKVPQNILNYILTIILLPALIAIINSVAGNLGYTFNFQKAEKTDSPTKPPTEKLITKETTNQSTGDNNHCPTQISGSDGNSVNCSTNITEKVENIERKIETPEQYNENNGSNPINCNRSNGTCGDDGTTNINLDK